MPVPIGRFQWDEQNDPRAFGVGWAVTQTVLICIAVLLKFGFIGSFAEIRYGQSTGAFLWRIAILLPFLFTAVAYVSLVFNGAWHRNAGISIASENGSDGIELSSPEIEERAEESALGVASLAGSCFLLR
ncbi:MAG: hypothetical protein ACLGSH_03205 [Acidobacteriota bacterium]